MFYQRMMMERMKHAEQHDLEEVDSCVKLLDLEVAQRRKRRNSIPFSLPSLHSITDSLSKLRHKSTAKTLLIPRRNTKLEQGIFPVVSVMQESVPKTSTSLCESIETPEHDKHLDHFTDEQNHEFFTAWRRIQGSRINLTE